MPDREKTIAVLELMLAMGPTSFSETEKEAIRAAVELLKEQEAVVRCKDCKWFHNNSTCYNEKVRFGCYRKPNWFCADGERKDNNVRTEG